MRHVFSHPLGPFPWSLANVDGSMRKTNKDVLAKQLEQHVSPEDVTHQPSATLVDAMSVIQKLHGDNHTFEELSDCIFSQMLHVGRESNRTDVICDVYKEESVESAERLNRGSLEGMIFNHIKPAHKIKKLETIILVLKARLH